VDAIALSERRGDATRCPFCLDAVRAEDERRCDVCGAPHHAACLAERGGACAVCQPGQPARSSSFGEADQGRLITTVGRDGITIQLPPPSFASLGPPLGIALIALCVVGLVCTLIVAVTDPQWFWAFGAFLLFGLEGAHVGLALLGRAVGRERLIIDAKGLRLQRRALGRFGEYVELPLADVQALQVWPTGRLTIGTASATRSFGRGLTQAEARWIGRTLGARLPR
jgi:hypothetical protein